MGRLRVVHGCAGYGRADVESREAFAGCGASGADLRDDDVANVGGGAGPEHDAVGDLAGQPEHGGERPAR